jgi:hypothetical protein
MIADEYDLDELRLEHDHQARRLREYLETGFWQEDEVPEDTGITSEPAPATSHRASADPERASTPSTRPACLQQDPFGGHQAVAHRLPVAELNPIRGGNEIR